MLDRLIGCYKWSSVFSNLNRSRKQVVVFASTAYEVTRREIGIESSRMSTEFHNFCVNWRKELHVLIQILISATRENVEDRNYQSQLIELVLAHYQRYYQVKSLYAKMDVVSILSGNWATSFERTFFWIGGCRPTIIFHTIYSECGHQFESKLEEYLSGIRSGDLGDLSACQLNGINEIQCETVHVEDEIEKEMFELQENFCNPLLSNKDIHLMLGKMTLILEKADDLRMRTLRRVTKLLNSFQAMEFLIAVMELHCGIHQLGVEDKQLILRRKKEIERNAPKSF